MIRYTQGNLLESGADALVNTVNTVGVMGKGIALMFKERFADNYRHYRQVCKAGELRTGQLLVTQPNELTGPRWIVNFPTKRDWRQPSKIEWVREGLIELRKFLEQNHVRSIAIPPLGAGNGGLSWPMVRAEIEAALDNLKQTEIIIFEPTTEYQNHTTKVGTSKLTLARALIVDLIRRYSVLGFECSLIEIQKLAWFLERAIRAAALPDPLDLRFKADRYGPYAYRLTKLLEQVDGSFLKCDKRLTDAAPLDCVWFQADREAELAAFLAGAEAAPYREALARVGALIDGYESPFGMELLATVDWLVTREGTPAETDAILAALAQWPAGPQHARRKQAIFEARTIDLALKRLQSRFAFA